MKKEILKKLIGAYLMGMQWIACDDFKLINAFETKPIKNGGFFETNNDDSYKSDGIYAREVLISSGNNWIGLYEPVQLEKVIEKEVEKYSELKNLWEEIRKN